LVFFDCQACGACCLNTERNRAAQSLDYVEVAKTDRLAQKENRALLEKYAVRNESGHWHLRLIDDDQRCSGLSGDLGEGVGCSLYRFRPAGCRLVESGDEECLKARRFHGLPTTLIAERARLDALEDD